MTPRQCCGSWLGAVTAAVIAVRMLYVLQKVVDFQWCPSSPWTMMSVSDDTNVDAEGGGSSKGGGTLQVTVDESRNGAGDS